MQKVAPISWKHCS